MGLNKTQVLTAAGCCGITVGLLFLILFPISWATLEPTEFGLDSDTISKKISEDVFVGGRYFLGVGHEFIKFSRTLQIIDFSSDNDEGGPALDAGTSDGQGVIIEVSLYYRTPRENIFNLYTDFGKDFKTPLVLRAQAVIKNTAILFSTLDFFTRREDIEDRMLTAVAQDFQKVNVEVQLLQLRNVDFPKGQSDIEQSLVNKVVAKQDAVTAAEDQKVQQIVAKTKVISANATANVTRTLGSASAQAFFIADQARAEGTRLVVETERKALVQLRDSLNFTNDQLLRYLWSTRKLRTAPGSDTLVMGFDNNAIINLGNGGS